MPATAAPARCGSTAGRSAPASSRWARWPAARSRPSRASRRTARWRRCRILPRARRGAVRHLHAGHADGGAGRPGATARAEHAPRSRMRWAACSAAAPAIAKIVDAVMACAPAAPAPPAARCARSARASPRLDGVPKVTGPRPVRRRCGAGRCAVDPRRTLATCTRRASPWAISVALRAHGSRPC